MSSLFWERCPKCGAMGRIDKEQKYGKVSVICTECGHHYNRKDVPFAGGG